MTGRILVGDSRELLKTLPADSVHCCVTSPPYFGLRDYGVDGQIGLEQTPEAFVAEMVALFEEVRRVLRPDGTLWLNLGDSYSVKSTYNAAQTLHTEHEWKQTGESKNTACYERACGVPAKNLLGIPWRVAFALQAAGWYLRQDIIWHKPNPMPESVRDRFTKAHEYIFMFSKSPKYYFDQQAVKEPAVKGAAGSKFNQGKTAEHQAGRSSDKPRKQDMLGKPTYTGFNDRWKNSDASQSETRNRRSVWTVSTKPFKGAHFATYPPDLIEPCILAGCPEGGTVLDPFFGAGTTGLVAQQHNRNWIGCELNPEYAALARVRVGLSEPIFDDLFGDAA